MIHYFIVGICSGFIFGTVFGLCCGWRLRYCRFILDHECANPEHKYSIVQ